MNQNKTHLHKISNLKFDRLSNNKFKEVRDLLKKIK